VIGVAEANLRVTEANRLWRRIFLGLAIALVAYAVLAPLTSLDGLQSLNMPLLANRLWFRIATLIAMFIAMASAWNIIGGLTGYAAFGNVAFFGIGAYTTGMLIAKAHWPFLLALPLSPLAAAIFAALVGLPLLRLHGHYFAVASLGVGVAVGELVQNIDYRGQPVFGGASGLFLPILRVPDRDVFFFYLMLGAAALAIAVTWWVMRSRFGFGLIAIRENEEAAEVIGVNTTAYKVAAFTLAAALTGLAGGIFSQWNSFINQDNAFPIEYNVQMILMALLGGAGTLFGPAAGAVLLQLLIQFLGGTLPITLELPFLPESARPIFAQIILGLLLVIVVIFAPRGIIDFFGGRSRLSLAYFRRSLRETSI
jgi:branched-chain amino acid transport system permease protein